MPARCFCSSLALDTPLAGFTLPGYCESHSLPVCVPLFRAALSEGKWEFQKLTLADLKFLFRAGEFLTLVFMVFRASSFFAHCSPASCARRFFPIAAP